MTAITVSAIVSIMLVLCFATPLVLVGVVLLVSEVVLLVSEPEEAGDDELVVGSESAILKIFASGESAGIFSNAVIKT